MSDPVSHETLCLTPAILMQVQQRWEGRRRKVHHHGLLCSKCLVRAPAGENDRYCRPCRAQDRRERRAAAKQELVRLKALEEQVKQSKGIENGRDEGSGLGSQAG